MTIPRNLACKYGLVYVPKHSRRTCCQSRYERPYMHHKVIFEKDRIYLLLYLLFNCMNAINYLIISYFGAVLFPVDLVTKRAMARRASSRLFSRIFLRDEHGLLHEETIGPCPCHRWGHPWRPEHVIS